MRQVLFGAAIAIVAFLVACDVAKFAPPKHGQSVSRAELEAKAVAQGLDPSEIDFKTMMEHENYDAFVIRPGRLTSRSVRIIEDQWPGRLPADVVGWHLDENLRKGVIYAEPVPPPTMTDQDQCYGLEVGPADSDFCKCLRDPAMCETHHPDNDGGVGGGGAGSDDSSDSAPLSASDVEIKTGAELRVFRNRRDVEYQAFAWTSINISTFVENVAYSPKSTVSAELNLVDALGNKTLVSTARDGFGFWKQARASVQMYGSVRSLFTTQAELLADHYAKTTSLGITIHRKRDKSVVRKALVR